MLSVTRLIVASGLLSLVSPAPFVDEVLHLRARASIQPELGSRISSAISSLLPGLVADAVTGGQIVSAVKQAAQDTIGDQFQETPTSVPDVLATISTIFSSTPTALISNILQLVPAGIPVEEVETLLTASIDPRNSVQNNNPPAPDVIYPKKAPVDAPYQLEEIQLREAIYIPDSFTYGQKPPVILVPGTGNTGFQTFAGNYIPLLTGVSYADPVWLNIPGQLLADIQINAEYVAYTINYISSLTGNRKNVSVITWSQGGIDAQWAFKYWPSTRSVTQNLIANSPDYHGTLLAYLLCPEYPTVPCDPSVLQQEYYSEFVSTLRNNGGDSAIVPTTNIFSSTDEIVQPQSPLTAASGYLKDDCQVGVTNVLIQDTCGGKGPAGLFYTHEGVLYNPLGYALTIDALKRGRPGEVSNLNLAAVCAEAVSPGLDLLDVLTTEEAILIAATSVLLYTPKVPAEPAIAAYATAGTAVPVCSDSTQASSFPGFYLV